MQAKHIFVCKHQLVVNESPLMFILKNDLLVQILCLYDNVDAIDVDKVVEYVKGLQQEDGSFAGDKWGKKG